MKIFRALPMLISTFLFSLSAVGQSFINLNFENSRPFNTDWARVPGWTQYNGWEATNYLGAAYLPYNDRTLDSPGVFLEGTDFWEPSISGRYSVWIWGGDIAAYGNGATALGQTGQIPIGTLTMTYWAQTQWVYNPLQVTFADQVLNFVPLTKTADYTIYGADVSALAGQVGELRFSVNWNTASQVIFDNIQFLTTPIPEPGCAVLFGLGLFGLPPMRLRKTGRAS